ncbi:MULTISPECIES: hypothetical protein [Pseudomonas]|nr:MULTISPECIES: hypothetical protein [Pseudomonas]MDG9926519.1 hypothetical protein [Pseudomonas sp. GD04042]MDH0481397.1 hypothetical protein [Pseudomonas sp. GD04015]MDH0603346.1 hypothetical protein [Pseudomonas sp. GD03869]
MPTRFVVSPSGLINIEATMTLITVLAGVFFLIVGWLCLEAIGS